MMSRILPFALLLAAAPGASALSFGLNFVSTTSSDIFGLTTSTADFSPFGFIGLTSNDIQTAVLNAVIADYLAYPTVVVDPLSPIGAGLTLSVNFYLTSNHAAPVSGDPQYYFINLGTDTGSTSALGQACLACVRTAAGLNPGSVTNGSIVGSVLLNNIGGLAGLASTNAQRINLIAGTTSHEIGHTVSLDHPSGPLSNPGASSYSIMASGTASGMPNAERILDRSFAYSEFAQLMLALGTAPDGTSIPEPSGFLLLGTGLVVLWTRRRG
jgi:hypothetical protein